MYAQRSNDKMKKDSSVIEYTETDNLPYSDKQLYSLITDVERYPEFLPGWLSVDVISRNESTIVAHQKIGVPLVNWEFESTAKLDQPRHVHVSAQDGPFHHLDIDWYLESVTRKITKVTITVEASMVLHARSILNTFLEKSVHSLLEHIAMRAQEIYGKA